MKMGLIGLVVAAGLLVSAPAFADSIDFESDPTGAKPNGWMSADSAYVKFSDTDGAELQIANFGVQSNGNGLAVNDDDTSGLRMDFSGPVSNLSLAFGNDDPRFSSPGDRAWLQVWSNNVLVGQTFVTMNRDDIMNQTIGIGGVDFDLAFFWYGDVNERPIGLIEVVDDIKFDAVPEPGTLALAGLGVAGLLLGRRRRRNK